MTYIYVDRVKRKWYNMTKTQAESLQGGYLMDFEKMLEGYKNKTCIISMERFSDGTCGNIRIAAGNKAHCDEFYSLMKRNFEPGL